MNSFIQQGFLFFKVLSQVPSLVYLYITKTATASEIKENSIKILTSEKAKEVKCYKIFQFQINVVLLNFVFLKES